jgi:phytoene synthase
MPTRSPDETLATSADHAACTDLLRHGSKTFQAASFALPADMRRAATALYAFCRLADDAVDLGSNGSAELARLRERLDAVYAGKPIDHPADRAFAEIVATHAIPRELPEALLDGFKWDLEGRRYRNLSELNAYAARVAGTVGAMMALLMGTRAPSVLARACDLGVAMQLTNIARDVGEDARLGRLYLPVEWLAEEGIDADAWLAHPVYTTGLGRVIERLLRHADTLYSRAAHGIASLPIACRPAMHAARLIYCEIGQEVRRRGHDSVNGRAIVPWTRKSQLLAAATVASARRQAATHAAMLEETRFLVEAAAAAMPPAPEATGLEGRVVWLVDLFARLEERDRRGASRNGGTGSFAQAT